MNEMRIERIRAVYFSPTGMTERVIRTMTAAAEQETGLVCEYLPLTRPSARNIDRHFTPTDLVFAAFPTYAGRLPNKLLPDLKRRLDGGGSFAAAAVTFGGRAYDNALAELCELLESRGFHTIAGGAFCCRHAFTDALAHDRPNTTDFAMAADFARRTLALARTCEIVPAPVQVPGDPAAPYYVPKGVDGQPVRFLKAKPVTDLSRCERCGKCAALCPMGAIDPRDPAKTPGTCIKCQACTRNCPQSARYFDDPAFLSHVEMLSTTDFGHPSSEVFFSRMNKRTGAG